MKDRIYADGIHYAESDVVQEGFNTIYKEIKDGNLKGKKVVPFMNIARSLMEYKTDNVIALIKYGCEVAIVTFPVKADGSSYSIHTEEDGRFYAEKDVY